MVENNPTTRVERLSQKDLTQISKFITILADAVNKNNPYISRKDLTRITKGIHHYRNEILEEARVFKDDNNLEQFRNARRIATKVTDTMKKQILGQYSLI